MNPGTFDLIQELFYRLQVSCLADLPLLDEDEREECDAWKVTEDMEAVDLTPPPEDDDGALPSPESLQITPDAAAPAGAAGRSRRARDPGTRAAGRAATSSSNETSRVVG